MDLSNLVKLIFIIFNLVTPTICWQFFTSLGDFKLSDSLPDPDVVHSTYIYGKCVDDTKIFYAHVHLDHMDVLGKVIIRGWLDLFRIPTCIVIRATSYEEDSFRSTAYNFQICVPRITYCHSKRRFKYYYYEWYIPLDVIGGMNWDLYFYGPPKAAW